MATFAAEAAAVCNMLYDSLDDHMLSTAQTDERCNQRTARGSQGTAGFKAVADAVLVLFKSITSVLFYTTLCAFFVGYYSCKSTTGP